jgi:hypothetical protein
LRSCLVLLVATLSARQSRDVVALHQDNGSDTKGGRGRPCR